MVQSLKKQDFDVDGADKYYNTFYKYQNGLKPIVLDYLFRNIRFITNNEKIRALTTFEYKNITKDTNIPVKLIHKFVSCFLIDLLRFRRFIQKNPQVLTSRDQRKKVRIYLHKLHRIAPVFDYKRARKNARILRKKLDHLFFWPQVMTQIAVTVFVTDVLDKNKPQKIIQTNLRSLCCCSAYAFHRTRNKVGLTTKYIKNL